MPEIATETFALFLGLYMLAAGAGVLADPDRSGSMIGEFRANGALTYLAAMFALILGAFIVTAHNVWTGPAAVFVTLIGWGALIEGLLLLALPGKFLDMFAPLATNRTFMRALGVFTLAVGALLIVAAVA